jgi:hypothetical protein
VSAGHGCQWPPVTLDGPSPGAGVRVRGFESRSAWLELSAGLSTPRPRVTGESSKSGSARLPAQSHESGRMMRLGHGDLSLPAAGPWQAQVTVTLMIIGSTEL